MTKRTTLQVQECDDTTNVRQEFNEAISLAVRMFPPAKWGDYTEAERKVVYEYARATNTALFERYRDAFEDGLTELFSAGDVSLDGDLDSMDAPTFVRTAEPTFHVIRAAVAQAEADLERQAKRIASLKDALNVLGPYMTDDTITVEQAHALWLADLANDPRHGDRWRAALAMVAAREAGKVP